MVWWRLCSPAALSFLLAIGLYAVTLGGTWVYDDFAVAFDDARLHDVHRWPEFLRQGYMVDAIDHLWRPLTSLSFAVQWKLHGWGAWAFHLVNILLHGAASALVAKLAGRLAASPRAPAAYAAGLLFASHPLHVEAVAYLVGRAESMATIGIVGGLLLFVRRPLTVPRALAVTGCYLFALLSKEQGLLLPLMLLAWTILAKCRGHAASLVAEGQSPTLMNASAPLTAARGEKGEGLKWLAFMLLASTAVYGLYRDSILKWFWETNVLDPVLNPVAHAHGVDRWLLPVAILGRYSQLMIAPLRLSPDYSQSVYTPHQSLTDPYLYAGFFTALLFAIALRLALVRRRVTVLFCLICLAASYLLIGNWMIIGTVFGERLMYLPSVFLCLLAGFAIERMARRPRLTLLAAVLALFSIRTVTYARHWNNTLGFYQYALREQPRSSMLYLLVADRYVNASDDIRADEVLAAGRAACPDCWNIWMASARVALRLERFDDAEQWARLAFKLRPGIMEAPDVMDSASRMAATRPVATRPARKTSE